MYITNPNFVKLISWHLIGIQIRKDSSINRSPSILNNEWKAGSKQTKKGYLTNSHTCLTNRIWNCIAGFHFITLTLCCKDTTSSHLPHFRAWTGFPRRRKDFQFATAYRHRKEILEDMIQGAPISLADSNNKDMQTYIRMQATRYKVCHLAWFTVHAK